MLNTSENEEVKTAGMMKEIPAGEFLWLSECLYDLSPTAFRQMPLRPEDIDWSHHTALGSATLSIEEMEAMLFTESGASRAAAAEMIIHRFLHLAFALKDLSPENAAALLTAPENLRLPEVVAMLYTFQIGWIPQGAFDSRRRVVPAEQRKDLRIVAGLLFRLSLIVCEAAAIIAYFMRNSLASPTSWHTQIPFALQTLLSYRSRDAWEEFGDLCQSITRGILEKDSYGGSLMISALIGELIRYDFYHNGVQAPKFLGWMTELQTGLESKISGLLGINGIEDPIDRSSPLTIDKILAITARSGLDYQRPEANALVPYIDDPAIGDDLRRALHQYKMFLPVSDRFESSCEAETLSVDLYKYL